MPDYLAPEPYKSALIAAVLSFGLCAIIYPFYIKWLRSKQIGQYLREEGPESHAVKAKTPTMGGLCFITVVAGISLFFLFSSNSISSDEKFRAGLVMACATACGLLGFVDDYSKVTSRSNRGLSAKFRLMAEIILGLLLGAGLSYLHQSPHLVLGLSLFSGILYSPDFGQAFQLVYTFAFIPFIMAASSNALNLHDGMDGLCAGTSLIVFACLALMLALLPEAATLSWLAAAAAGAMAAFLLFNKYPAKVFMGDTGSLFIGGLMAGLVVAGGLVIWFVPLSLIYIIETISVMAQVSYFKLTKPFQPPKPTSPLSLAFYKLTHKLPGEGKRLLRMAPIHHHFEALGAEKGLKEWDIVLAFWLAQSIIACLTLVFFCKMF